MRGEGWVEQGLMWRCTEMKGEEELSRVWRGRTGHRGVWRCGTWRDVEVWSREGVKGC